jgi:hypothetical protein
MKRHEVKIWCRGEDLNLHESPHMYLKHACLPVSPPRHEGYGTFPLKIISLNLSAYNDIIFHISQYKITANSMTAAALVICPEESILLS